MFTVIDPLLEFTYHLLYCWRKFALCIQSLLCMLFFSGWPPCQRSHMILMEVSQRAYDMIHYISGLFGYFYVCEIYVNLIWYLYLFMLNKFCLSLGLSLIFRSPTHQHALHSIVFQAHVLLLVAMLFLVVEGVTGITILHLTCRSVTELKQNGK